RDALEARNRAEYWRNLYVAMTRAEEALHVAGTLPGRTDIAETWHGAIAGALHQESETVPDHRGEVLRFPAGARALPEAADGAVEERTSNVPLSLGPPRRISPVPVLTPSNHRGEWV